MRDPDAVDIMLDWQCEVDWPELPASAESLSRQIVQATVQRMGLRGSFEVSLVITDDRRMRRINRQFRGIDKTTDVLSFPQSAAPLLALPFDQTWVARAMGDDTHGAPESEIAMNAIDFPPEHAASLIAPPLFVNGDQGQPYHLGDIMISVPTVIRQAAEANHSAWWECCFLVAHGTLHLLGYDDYYEAGYRAMVAHQEAILVELAISRERK